MASFPASKSPAPLRPQAIGEPRHPLAAPRGRTHLSIDSITADKVAAIMDATMQPQSGRKQRR